MNAPASTLPLSPLTTDEVRFRLDIECSTLAMSWARGSRWVSGEFGEQSRRDILVLDASRRARWSK